MARDLIAQVIDKKTRKVIQVIGRFTDGDAAWEALDRHARRYGFSVKSTWRYRLVPVNH